MLSQNKKDLDANVKSMFFERCDFSILGIKLILLQSLQTRFTSLIEGAIKKVWGLTQLFFISIVVIKGTQREHSVEEVLERPTGYPKVGGSNHGSGDFSLQPQRNPYLS